MERWWMTPDAVAAVDHALYSYLNRSTALSDPVDVCDLQFRATNVLFSAFDDCTRASEPSEAGNVRATPITAAADDDRTPWR